MENITQEFFDLYGIKMDEIYDAEIINSYPDYCYFIKYRKGERKYDWLFKLSPVYKEDMVYDAYSHKLIPISEFVQNMPLTYIWKDNEGIYKLWKNDAIHIRWKGAHGNPSNVSTEYCPLECTRKELETIVSGIINNIKK